jgi:hypothetical protein
MCAQVRQSAGLLLKNNLKTSYTTISEDFRTYIKASGTARWARRRRLHAGMGGVRVPPAACRLGWTTAGRRTAHPQSVSLQGDQLHALTLGQQVLRHTAGSIITTVVGASGLAAWPELVMALAHR